MGSKLDENIPGFTHVEQLEFLATRAKQVPENGWIVEVGSYCGRSSYALGMNKHRSTLLTCIDHFPRDALDVSPDAFGNKVQKYCHSTWEENTKNCVNTESVRMILPLVSKGIKPSRPIDLIFLDAGHTYDFTMASLRYWHHFLKQGGTFVIDDYIDGLYPEVIQAVDDFIKEQDIMLFVEEDKYLAWYIKQ